MQLVVNELGTVVRIKVQRRDGTLPASSSCVNSWYCQPTKPWYNVPPMGEVETRIIHCTRCKLHTRHTHTRWVRRPLLLLLLGRVRVISGWKCNKCGQRKATKYRAVPARRA
jgi:hypothetical protein